MKLDETSLEVLQEIQEELKKEDNIELSIQEIADVVKSEFDGANYAFSKGVNVRLPIIGSFLRKHGLEKNKEAAILNGIKDKLSKEEYERKVLEAKLRNKQKRKERRAMPTISLKALKETKKLSNTPNTYNKL